MNEPILFSTYLHDLMSARRMTLDELVYEVGDIHQQTIQSWLNGWSRPEVADLPKVARALHVDLAEVAAGWMICSLPEVEHAFVEAILTPRSSKFPHSSDWTLRAPVRRRPVVLPTMDVDDPHDREPLSKSDVGPGARKRSTAARD